MQAIRELYKTGRGPSSSHTLAPERACKLFTRVNGSFPYYEAELFGSLSLTGKGHQTDQIIRESLPGETKIIFSSAWEEDFPNGFYLRSFDHDHILQCRWTVFSLGGGSIQIKEYPVNWNDEVYPEKNFHDVLAYCSRNDCSLADYVYHYEPDLRSYLETVLDAMCASVERGLTAEGILPGKLKIKRSAAGLYQDALTAAEKEKERLLLMSYAYAASEENANGGTCVTAPTLGACGVMASLFYHAGKDWKMDRKKRIDALAAGGVFGNIIKTNATISGAVGGCQAEVGAAVSMASAAYAYMLGLDTCQVEYAAEIGMEHNLGLTCDPVLGYVMIPCIERNAMGVLRAIDAAELAKYMTKIRHHLVSFDMVVDTMRSTGKSLPISLKETSQGGLAKEFNADGTGRY